MPIVHRISRRLRGLLTQPAGTRVGGPHAVSGRLCLSSAAGLRRRLFSLLTSGQGRALALEVSGVRFMDGAALAVLVEFAQACLRHGVNLRLIEPSQYVWDAFQLYGLAELLIEFADFREAELDGVLIILEEDFPESIALPAAA